MTSIFFCYGLIPSWVPLPLESPAGGSWRQVNQPAGNAMAQIIITGDPKMVPSAEARGELFLSGGLVGFQWMFCGCLVDFNGFQWMFNGCSMD